MKRRSPEAPRMKNDTRTRWLFWSAVALFGLVLGWWMVFFARLGNVLVERLEKAGADLRPDQAQAVRAAAGQSLRMLLFEGSFLLLLLLAGVVILLRVTRRELLLHRQHRNFMSAVTHELRSPIASARLHVQSLRLGRVGEEKRETYLLRAEEDLERLAEAVDQLLETARSSSGQTQLTVEPLDLAEFTARTAERIATRETPGVALEVDAPGPVSVRADGAALEMILRNLIANAVKYGGDPPRVRVSVTSEKREGRIEVRDFGPGWKGTDPREAFDPFIRGESELVRSRPGMGLGLFLVAELARALGGRVRAQNAPEGGFAVEVALPLAAEATR